MTAPSGRRTDLAVFGLPDAPAFALLHRPGSAPGRVEVLAGEPVTVPTVADLPLPPLDAGADRTDLLAVLPYRQIADRGLSCVDDGEPLVAIRVVAQATMRIDAAIECLAADPLALDGGAFDVTDEEYEAIVRRVRDEHIGRGDGSNFVIRRTFQARFDGWSRRRALAMFRRVLLAERGAYWTFAVHWNGRTLIGATPECHVRLDDGTATMNPISGTYRYPPSGPDPAGLRRFLADRKENEELLMVVDEELKMMARVCDGGGRVRGPWLRPMSRLAHTEYLIEGPTRLDVREILRQTTPAPTVTGSPVSTACRVIAQRERTGRGYYGGVLALIGQRHGRRTLDSALIIRTADVDAGGSVGIAVGATLVRHSDPAAEVAETRAKAAALIQALSAQSFAGIAPTLGDDGTRAALAARNHGLSTFWRGLDRAAPMSPELAGRRLLVIDADDDFTAMMARLAESLGLSVEVRPWHAPVAAGGHDIVLVGPGPGDPRDRTDPRIGRLRETVRALLADRTPMLAVCLGHQILAAELGLDVTRMDEPAQGVQRSVPMSGRLERVGFYHTFVAVSATDERRCPITGDPVRIERDPATGSVYALTKANVRSVQFHVESLLTEHGTALLREMLISVRGNRGDRWGSIDDFVKVRARTIGGSNSPGR